MNLLMRFPVPSHCIISVLLSSFPVRGTTNFVVRIWGAVESTSCSGTRTDCWTLKIGPWAWGVVASACTDKSVEQLQQTMRNVHKASIGGRCVCSTVVIQQSLMVICGYI